MNSKSPQFRIGNGYDIHRLVEGRNLIIGGVKLIHPDNLGLDGHSDADVLSHSISDALLGALSLGDIGKYFPPTEDRWKNADSLFLLSKIMEIVRNEGWEINNIDSVIVAERPKIKPYVDSMKQNILNTFNLDEDEKCDLEFGALEKLAKERQVMFFKHKGNWECMDHERDVKYLNDLYNNNSAFWKRYWLAKHKYTPTDAIFTGRKEKYATYKGKANILIDDSPINIERWTQAGGFGILYQANRDQLTKVKKGLEDYGKIRRDQ